MIPTIFHSGKGSLKISGWQWFEMGQGLKKKAQTNFRAVKLFCVILGWLIHGIQLTKPIEYATPGMNPNVNYGLPVITICQCT